MATIIKGGWKNLGTVELLAKWFSDIEDFSVPGSRIAAIRRELQRREKSGDGYLLNSGDELAGYWRDEQELRRSEAVAAWCSR